ncbi:MAG: hypothetical protein B0D94_01370 [Candidatus Sedimenticola endophacoides]|nr:MAG: hypothetical protein B0D94_01370 [Candidatus Sedimenticola endophacoides]
MKHSTTTPDIAQALAATRTFRGVSQTSIQALTEQAEVRDCPGGSHLSLTAMESEAKAVSPR